MISDVLFLFNLPLKLWFCSSFLSLVSHCFAVPEQRMHSVLRYQRHRQAHHAESEEPRGTVRRKVSEFNKFMKPGPQNKQKNTVSLKCEAVITILQQ